MAANRSRKVITATGASVAEAKANANASIDAALVSFGFSKVEGYAARYIWRDSNVYIDMTLSGTSTSISIVMSDNRGTESGTFSVTVVTGSTASGYSCEMVLDAYLSGNTIMLLVYGISSGPTALLITPVMLDGVLDYAYNYPYSSSTAYGFRCINQVFRPWYFGLSLTTPQIIKMDNVAVTIGTAIRGYLLGISGFVTDATTPVARFTTDGHEYLCMRLYTGVNNMVGIEIE